MKNFMPLLYKDFYKTGHVFQYPEGTEYVYSNWTPRSSRVPNVDRVVFFGLQYFIKEYLIRQFNENFFDRPKEEVVGEYKRVMNNTLGPGMNIKHIAELHDLGYLPIRIKALKEGSLVPLRVPMLTIVNTHPKFFWVTNMLETLMSNVLWKPCTSATTAFQYLKRFYEYAKHTGASEDFIQWQGHDFSYRGMSGNEDACLSGAAHLLSFTGTDTIPAIPFLEEYYRTDIEKELVGGSVPASEHSVMSMGGDIGEFNTFKRFITEIYPSGIVSIVSDTWDLFQVINEYLPRLKDEILARDGKVVIRPDSSPKTPFEILCGDTDSDIEHERKGVVELLWDIFGGTVNKKGFKELDPHIGVIYGDSITMELQHKILHELYLKGFASSNVVLGIGSFTYEYVTRDTYGFAMKATWGQINGKPVDIYKNPKTDNGVKKSAKGLLRVDQCEHGHFRLTDQVSLEEEADGALTTVFEDGRLLRSQTLAEIRELLRECI